MGQVTLEGSSTSTNAPKVTFYGGMVGRFPVRLGILDAILVKGHLLWGNYRTPQTWIMANIQANPPQRSPFVGKNLVVLSRPLT